MLDAMRLQELERDFDVHRDFKSYSNIFILYMDFPIV